MKAARLHGDDMHHYYFNSCLRTPYLRKGYFRENFTAVRPGVGQEVIVCQGNRLFSPNVIERCSGVGPSRCKSANHRP